MNCGYILAVQSARALKFSKSILNYFGFRIKLVPKPKRNGLENSIIVPERTYESKDQKIILEFVNSTD